jgi:aldehyde dehydrogenase family 7 protein A1
MDTKRNEWARLPAPVRGQIVRDIGEALRTHKEDLASIISLEMGKIYPEALGEVQEGIDICEFALGISRQVGGSVFPSERPDHFMMERWLPLKGNVGIITAFNFPAAVYFWNAALSLVCGNTQILKPAPTGSLIAIACTKVVNEVLAKHGFESVNSLFLGDADVGNAIVEDNKTTLVSFTGSTHVGRKVAQTVAGRFGEHILELGGNNATVVMPDADLDMVIMSSVFGAVGTAGQRCTSLRRMIIHEDVYDQVRDGLVNAYKTVPIGNPLHKGTLMGPLHNQAAVDKFLEYVKRVPTEGGKVIYGGAKVDGPGNFVTPAIAEMPTGAQMLQEELFAPLLYLVKVKSLEEAIEINNGVDQGLSSSLFTKNQAAVFHWTGPLGSDCGIANVNIGTSGAEIGGAFGGEKATGGGRESGSDAWKGYCRRQTITVNYSKELPLAQGIVFGDIKPRTDGKGIYDI